MPQPCHCIGYQVRYEVILIWPLARDNMPEDRLGRRAAYHEALDNLAREPLRLECAVAGLVLRELELLPELDATSRDVEIVQADDRDRRAPSLAVGCTTATAHEAPLAPQPVR